MAAPSGRRILVAIPAYQEAATVGSVASGVRRALPDCDVLVIDDGSRDGTREALTALDVAVAPHLSNLGYGRAIQTALTCALRGGYDAVVTLDADGQHDPSQLPGVLAAFDASGVDLLLGSRYVATRSYSGAPLGRRLGMAVLSALLKLLTGRRLYDTTTGLKVIRRSAFEPLLRWHFVDFHSEALVYLLRLGHTVEERPIAAAERRHGTSMYGPLSALTYPLKTLTMAFLALFHARATRASARP
jgi:glycosyltransferase involved in cell wall biosynthesis